MSHALAAARVVLVVWISTLLSVSISFVYLFSRNKYVIRALTDAFFTDPHKKTDHVEFLQQSQLGLRQTDQQTYDPARDIPSQPVD